MKILLFLTPKYPGNNLSEAKDVREAEEVVAIG
jgi:hypothetical protein